MDTNIYVKKLDSKDHTARLAVFIVGAVSYYLLKGLKRRFDDLEEKCAILEKELCEKKEG